MGVPRGLSIDQIGHIMVKASEDEVTNSWLQFNSFFTIPSFQTFLFKSVSKIFRIVFLDAIIVERDAWPIFTVHVTTVQRMRKAREMRGKREEKGGGGVGGGGGVLRWVLGTHLWLKSYIYLTDRYVIGEIGKGIKAQTYTPSKDSLILRLEGQNWIPSQTYMEGIKMTSHPAAHTRIMYTW